MSNVTPLKIYVDTAKEVVDVESVAAGIYAPADPENGFVFPSEILDYLRSCGDDELSLLLNDISLFGLEKARFIIATGFLVSREKE